jgi:hypothetical protein
MMLLVCFQDSTASLMFYFANISGSLPPCIRGKSLACVAFCFMNARCITLTLRKRELQWHPVKQFPAPPPLIQYLAVEVFCSDAVQNSVN